MPAATCCVTPEKLRFCRYQGVVDAASRGTRIPTATPRLRALGLGMAFLWLVHTSAIVYSLNRGAGAPAPQALTATLLFAPLGIIPLLAYLAARLISRVSAQASRAAEMGMYELESRIAMGGMGEVWRARHRYLSRPAAVKLIRAQDDAGPGTPATLDSTALARFEREAQVTASLKSPHTVELYDFGVTKTGTFYYVMELLDGDDLERRVKREGPFEPWRVVRILEQALDSLAEAHQLGLVHRDIKPANIHVAQRGLEKDFVKILDFGLVKRNNRLPTENSLSQVNTMVGTPAYLAPEAITLEAPVDARADIYSLGCVAYYLLTGKLVFEAETVMAMAVAHVTAKPVAPSTRARHAIPADLERIVLACLEKSPESRPQSAVELLAMLKRLKLTRDGSAHDRMPSSPQRERVRAVN